MLTSTKPLSNNHAGSAETLAAPLRQAASAMRKTTITRCQMLLAITSVVGLTLGTAQGSHAASHSAAPTVGINGVAKAAITPTVALTDMWFNPQESGWGMSMIQHASTKVFAVVYAYAADNKPLWLVMSDSTWLSPTSFSGKLYQTTGPIFTLSTFNPTDVRVTEVGMLTVAASADGSAANLTYNVNGVTVIKAISRQGF